MTTETRLFLERQHPDQADHLWDIVALLKRDDPLAPVTVVGPSVYANLGLRNELAATGFANVRFMVLPRVSELLGAPDLARRNLRPLTPIVERAAIRAVLAETPGRLSELRSNPGTMLSLRSTFREIRSASASALVAIASRGGVRSEVVELYEKFREKTAAYYDRESLALAAAEAVRNNAAPGLSDLGFVVCYHLSQTSPAEQRLIEALGASGACAVILGLTGDPAADGAVETLGNRLETSLGQARVHDREGSERKREVLVAPNPTEEVRWGIRRILRAAEDGVPFHRNAILYRKWAPYSSLVREELEMAGLPVAGPDNIPLSRTAVGRTLSGLMQVAEGDFRRETVMAWLTECPVRLIGASAAGSVPSRWEEISKSAGVVEGLDQWDRGLLRFADAQQRRADSAEALGEMSESRAAYVRSTAAAAARELRDFIKLLAGYASAPPDGSPWADFCDWATDLLRRFLLRSEQMPEAELAALDSVEEQLQGMKAAEGVEASPSFNAFKQSLDETLATALGHVGTTGQGVFVAPLRAALAMRFDAVHVVGMVEGAVPPPTRDDPLIPDADRLSAGGEAAGLPVRRARSSRERYEFLSAMATAQNVVLSFPASEQSGGRANYPSRWLLEAASELEGTRVSTTSLPSLSDRPWLTVIPSMEAGLATVGATAAADRHEYDLERMWRWVDGGRSLRSHPTVREGSLSRSLESVAMRNSNRLTEWDGNISFAGASTGVGDWLETAAHSPTSLERWATCPFSYFLGSVLRLSAPETPGNDHSISALERGSLIHSILERFLRQSLEADNIPAARERWTAGHTHLLRQVAAEEFDRVELAGAAGSAIMWALEKQEILDDLEAFLRRDFEVRSEYGVTPALVEASFGMGQGSAADAVLPLEDGTEIRFRGMIDRIDTSEDGRRALVIDYKTGNDQVYRDLEKEPFDRGRRLQLPVYSLAADGLLGREVEVAAAYWFVTSRGGFGFRPSEPGLFNASETRSRFGEVVHSIVSGIGSGTFPADPGTTDGRGRSRNCRYCDFDSLCPARRDVLWDRKRGDPIVSDYIALSEGRSTRG